MGLGFAWTYYWGQWSRLAKTELAASHGPWWGWGPRHVLCQRVQRAHGHSDRRLRSDRLVRGTRRSPLGCHRALSLHHSQRRLDSVTIYYTATISIKVAKPNIRWIHASVTIPDYTRGRPLPPSSLLQLQRLPNTHRLPLDCVRRHIIHGLL